VLCLTWDDGSGSGVVDAAPTASSVAIADFAFAPAQLTVAAGTTVTWTNSDGFAHTVDAADDTFVSEALDQGATFSHTFDAAGTFAYICGIHPSMAGTVVVTE
jgi:plastocyanin